MAKYDIKLVNDYIYGNDIVEYDVNELENDFEFMVLVFEQTNDKKMYYYCSRELKKDFRLVKYLINKFSYDIDYICLVADTFIVENENEIELIELLLIMKMYTWKYHKKNIGYEIKLALIYSEKMTKINLVINDDEELREELGMGFYVIYDEFCSSKLATDYFAKRIINSLLREYEISLEEYLHNNFKNVTDIERKGINTILLDYIYIHDEMLSSYVSSNIGLMSDLLEKFEFIKKNWNNYEENQKAIKYDLIFKRVNEYLEGSCGHTLSECELLYYAAKNLEIEQEMKKYDSFIGASIYEIREKMGGNDSLDRCSYSEDEVFVENIAFDNNYLNENEIPSEDIIHIKNIEKIILEILNNDFTEDSDFESVNSKNEKCKFLNFRLK